MYNTTGSSFDFTALQGSVSNDTSSSQFPPTSSPQTSMTPFFGTQMVMPGTQFMPYQYFPSPHQYGFPGAQPSSSFAPASATLQPSSKEDTLDSNNNNNSNTTTNNSNNLNNNNSNNNLNNMMMMNGAHPTTAANVVPPHMWSQFTSKVNPQTAFFGMNYAPHQFQGRAYPMVYPYMLQMPTPAAVATPGPSPPLSSSSSFSSSLLNGGGSAFDTSGGAFTTASAAGLPQNVSTSMTFSSLPRAPVMLSTSENFTTPTTNSNVVTSSEAPSPSSSSDVSVEKKPSRKSRSSAEAAAKTSALNTDAVSPPARSGGGSTRRPNRPEYFYESAILCGTTAPSSDVSAPISEQQILSKTIDSDFFGKRVPVYTAVKDPLRRPLFPAKELGRFLGCNKNLLSMYLCRRKKKQMGGIYQATSIMYKKSCDRSVRLGGYFLTQEACERFREIYESKGL